MAPGADLPPTVPPFPLQLSQVREVGMVAGRERGQALPLVAVVVAVAGLVVLGIGRLGAVVVARAEAQAAADATALAGATRGRGAADVVAAEDGARIVSWAAAGAEVEVVVEVRGERARARARRG